MLGDWEARIVYVPGSMANAVYLSRRIEYGRQYLKHTGKTNTIVTVKNDEPSKQDLAFAYLEDSQLQALAVAMKEFGTKLPDAGYVNGELTATKKHLEDMRSIVGHVKKIKLEADND